MKKLLLLLLFPLLLVSCGKDKHYGHYAFQMGSDKGDHFGMFIDLKKDRYTHEDPETHEKEDKGETFKFGAMLSKDMAPTEPKESDYPDTPSFLEAYLAYFLCEEMNVEGKKGKDAGFEGYYTLGDQYVDGKGYKIDMNIVLNKEQAIDVDANFLKKFLIAYIDHNILNIVTPVSVPDLRYQLCWYGIFISEINVGKKIIIPKIIEIPDGILPGAPLDSEQRLGSHPSKTDIVEMNKEDGKFQKWLKEQNLDEKFTFKDWNTLTVGLTK